MALNIPHFERVKELALAEIGTGSFDFAKDEADFPVAHQQHLTSS
jgi:hypothetical protein